MTTTARARKDQATSKKSIQQQLQKGELGGESELGEDHESPQVGLVFPYQQRKNISLLMKYVLRHVL